MSNAFDKSKRNILLTGATGLIGQSLCRVLYDAGFNILILSRNKKKDNVYHFFQWDLDSNYIEDELAKYTIDYVIHLAGAPIADKKWTKNRKAEIISSRVDSTILLADFLKKHNIKPKLFISASAIGIYGNRPQETNLTEKAQINEKSEEFLVKSCLEWEKSSAGIKDLDIPLTHVRIGIVLSTRGGALVKMLPSYKFGLGTYFGNGSQIYSWIHIEDLCNIFIFILRQKNPAAVYNATAPVPVSNKKMSQNIANALKRKVILLPIPEIALNTILGEMSNVVTDSAHVIPNQLLEEGFKFQFQENFDALCDLLSRKI